MLNRKLQTNVFCFVHSVDCVQLRRPSLFAVWKLSDFFLFPFFPPFTYDLDAGTGMPPNFILLPPTIYYFSYAMITSTNQFLFCIYVPPPPKASHCIPECEVTDIFLGYPPNDAYALKQSRLGVANTTWGVCVACRKSIITYGVEGE